MSPKEKAQQLYYDAHMRWCYELSHDKNRLIAKSICEYICNEMLDLWENQQSRRLEIFDYWKEVKEEIAKL